MRLSFLLLLFSMLALACEKDDPPPACEVNETGTIVVLNASGEDVVIEIDGVVVIPDLEPGVTQEIEVPAGSVVFRGYFRLYPDEVEWDVAIALDVCESFDATLI